MNLATWMILLVLTGGVTLVVRGMIHDKKSGKACGGCSGCSGCAGNGNGCAGRDGGADCDGYTGSGSHRGDFTPRQIGKN